MFCLTSHPTDLLHIAMFRSEFVHGLSFIACGSSFPEQYVVDLTFTKISFEFFCFPGISKPLSCFTTCGALAAAAAALLPRSILSVGMLLRLSSSQCLQCCPSFYSSNFWSLGHQKPSNIDRVVLDIASINAVSLDEWKYRHINLYT